MVAEFKHLGSCDLIINSTFVKIYFIQWPGILIEDVSNNIGVVNVSNPVLNTQVIFSIISLVLEMLLSSFPTLTTVWAWCAPLD